MSDEPIVFSQNITPLQNNDVIAVIISYYPELDHLMALIRALQQQNVLSILVDNGSLTPSMLDALSNLAQVIALPENLGIAQAQNIGIHYAQEHYTPHFIVFLIKIV